MNSSCLDLVADDVRGANMDETLAMTRFVIQWIYMPTVVLFGVIANLLNIVVLTRKDMFSSTNYYLASLACCDILFLTGGLLCTMPKLIPPLILCHPFMFLITYFQAMTTFVSNLSVVIICCFTCERFIVIRWPIKGRVWFTRDKAKRIVLAAVLFTLFVEVPNLIFYAPVFEQLPPIGSSRANFSVTSTSCTNATGCGQSMTPCQYWKKKRTSLGQRAKVFIFAANWITAVLFAFLPLLLLSVLNGYLIRSVMIARNERCQMTHSYVAASLVVPSQHCVLLDPSCRSTITSHQAKARREHNNERKVTIMLIAVILLFIACHLPNAFGLLYSAALEWQYQGKTPEDIHINRLIMNNIFNALTQLNAAANFILYSLLSKKFNQTMRRLLTSFMTRLCRWCRLRCHRNRNRTEMSCSNSSFTLKMASVNATQLERSSSMHTHSHSHANANANASADASKVSGKTVRASSLANGSGNLRSNHSHLNDSIRVNSSRNHQPQTHNTSKSNSNQNAQPGPSTSDTRPSERQLQLQQLPASPSKDCECGSNKEGEIMDSDCSRICEKLPSADSVPQLSSDSGTSPTPRTGTSIVAGRDQDSSIDLVVTNDFGPGTDTLSHLSQALDEPFTKHDSPGQAQAQAQTQT